MPERTWGKSRFSAFSACFIAARLCLPTLLVQTTTVAKNWCFLFTAQNKLPENSSPAVRNDWTASAEKLQSALLTYTQTHMHGTPKVHFNILTETQATSKFKQPSVTCHKSKCARKQQKPVVAGLHQPGCRTLLTSD